MHRYPLLILFTALLAACDNFDANEPVIVGTVERDRIELTAESNDPITAIHVTEGDAVSGGSILLEQDASLYEARLEQLHAARDRADSRLAELVRGPRTEDITAVRARLQGALSNLAIQQREYQRLARLLDEKLVSPSVLDQALELRESALANRDRLEAELAAMLAGTTVEELDQARAALREAEAEIRSEEIRKSRLTIIAPVDGIIDSLPYETGERPLPGSTVAVLLSNNTPYARVYIPEPLRARVTPGLEAVIRVDGLPDDFQGRVRYISQDVGFTPYYALTQRDRSRLSFLAEIDFIEARAADLPGGVPVEVSFPSLSVYSQP